jgi:UDPglucose 6-dehydrogenase
MALIDDLTSKGMRIRAYDPQAGDAARKRLAENGLVEILDNEYAALEGAQALAVVTEWNQFRNPDFERIKKALTVPVIFDGRNLYQPDHLSAMGFAYFCIGRV